MRRVLLLLLPLIIAFCGAWGPRIIKGPCPSVTAAPEWTPGNIGNGGLFLSYADIPADTSFWTNRWGPQRFTNKVDVPNVTNSTEGWHYIANGLGFWTNGNSGIRWSNQTDSAWFAVKLEATTSGYGPILGTAHASLPNGANFFPASPSPRFYYGGANAGNLVTNVFYSITCNPTNRSGSWYNFITTNGVRFSDSIAVNTDTPNTVVGVCTDGAQNRSHHYFVKFVAVFTNYTLTPTDISNLNVYAQSH